MADVRREVREAAPATEPSEEEVHSLDSESPCQLRRARKKADFERMQSALDEVLPDVFAAAREVSRRKLEMRPFDVQLLGGIVLHRGMIAEMKTGEGKTLVAPLAAALNAMSGWGVHVITVNDYLAKRDPQWMGPIFHGLGLLVGIIQHDTAYIYDPDYKTNDETLRPPAPGRAQGGLRRGRHLRHQQRAWLRLPPRQHGPGARRACSAQALLRHRRRGRQHPHRRGSHAAHHQRRGRRVGRHVQGLRPSGAAGSSRARRTPRKVATTTSTSRRRPSRRPKRASPRSRRCSTSATSMAWRPTRGCRGTSSSRCERTRSTSATATTSSRTARSSSSTSSPVDRCPAVAGRRACTRRWRPRRACGSSASR